MTKMIRLDRSSARRAMFAVPLWACTVVPAFAEQQEATIVLGAGQKSCGEYLAAVYGLSPGYFRVATPPLLMCGCGNTASKTELAAWPTQHSSSCKN
jgi:hypothetical protein